MSPALLGASDALRSRPEHPFAAPPSHCLPSHAALVPRRQAVPGRERICGGEQRSVRGRRAQRASRNLTRRVCWSAESEANEATYAARPRTEQRSAVDAQHRPPQLSGLPGTARRELVVIEDAGILMHERPLAPHAAAVEEDLEELVGRHRARKQEPLCGIALEVLHPGLLLGLFDALGRHADL